MTPRSKAAVNHRKLAYFDELARDKAERVLKPHGYALIKVNQGADAALRCICWPWTLAWCRLHQSTIPSLYRGPTL